jgi:hypothetical protein
MSDPDLIEPFGEPYPAYRTAENDPLPRSQRTAPRVRFRDLPRAEQLRLRVEEAVRYYALQHGKILTAQAIGHRWKWKLARVGQVTVEEIATALNDPVTIANLRRLGLLPEDVLSWDEALEGRLQPDAEQMDALEAVLSRIDPDEKRPLAEVLGEQGIELKQWNGWLADPIFAGYVRSRMEAVLGQQAHEVDIALFRRVVAGDTQAIKLMLQLQGRLTDQRAVDTGQLLGRVLEILLEEITDQRTIERIARRFEALSQQVTSGRAPALLEAAETAKTIIPGEVALP